jgi:hypothetical protein
MIEWNNGEDANLFTALYIATSQDSACVAEQWKSQDLGSGTDFISKVYENRRSIEKFFLNWPILRFSPISLRREVPNWRTTIFEKLNEFTNFHKQNLLWRMETYLIFEWC